MRWIGKLWRGQGAVARPTTKPHSPTDSETDRASNPREDEMRTIDEIVAATLKSTESALREAFEAGRAHTATALKAKMAAFFEGLISEAEGNIAAPPSEGSHHDDHISDGQHHE
jgi:hypothetical protein